MSDVRKSKQRGRLTMKGVARFLETYLEQGPSARSSRAGC